MKLTQQDFVERRKANELSIALVGMSGMGKSYRAEQLGGLGFAHYCVDNEIAKRISALLPSEDVGGLALWMGQPYADLYADRERQYLDLEERMTRRGVESAVGNRIVDTTGSVVYLSPELLAKLKDEMLVVYMEANNAVRERMFEQYIKDPKPVVWGASFVRRGGESDLAALTRCYPELLEYRASRYRALADISLPYAIARDQQSTAEQFLDVIYHALL